VILCKSDVRVTARNHFRRVAMCDAEATRKVFDLVREECVGGALADLRFDRSTVARTSSGLDRVGLRHARAGARHVREIMDTEWIAFSHEQRAAAIARKESRMRLDGSKLTQGLQRSGPAHDDIGVKTGGARKLEGEIAE
jgi:hypothetical protein